MTRVSRLPEGGVFAGSTRRPRLLDAFCGEGGAGWGYHLAGWDVVGVDLDPARLRRYPLEHVHANAVLYIAEHGHEFDAIHASPPCQGYSRGTVALPGRADRYDRLIAVTREVCRETGRPYVIENVEGARRELHTPTLLCGRMFGLGAVDSDGTPLVLDRHRLFESCELLLTPEHLKHDRTVQVGGVYGGARRDKVEARTVRRGGYVPADLSVLKALIGADWMSEQGLFLSIPPAYTQHIGEHLLAAVAAPR